MDIGAKLKELRILKGLTQEELADRAELSKGFISRAGKGLNFPLHRDSHGHFLQRLWDLHRRVL